MYSFEVACKREKNSSLTHAIFLVTGGFLVDKNFRNAYLALVLLAQRKGRVTKQGACLGDCLVLAL
jgi:hypothetical protein